MNRERPFRPQARPAAAWRAVAAGLLLFGVSGAAAPASEADEKAILKGMSDYLAAQQTIQLALDSDIEVITPEMEKIQFASSGEALLSRPDKLRARRLGGYADVELIFDGRTMSVHDRGGDAYAQVEVEGTVDQLVGSLRASHGVAMPGGDLLLTQVYEVLMADVIEAKHTGRGVSAGRECEHLAFRNFDTDWQIWIAVGDEPLPCKMVITSKTISAAPQYTLRITAWEAGGPIAADAFAFAPPAGATLLDPNGLIDLDELPPPAEGGSQ